MLQVDLGRLERERRVTIEAEIPPEAPLWDEVEAKPRGPLSVDLKAEQAGADVVVRGHVGGEVGLPCRRCLVAVDLDVDEEVSFLFVSGLDPAEAEEEGVYGFSSRDRELDLTEPLREQLLLALPQFAVCREACRGLCPRCGTNWNEATCECEAGEVDERWAALRRLKSE